MVQPSSPRERYTEEDAASTNSTVEDAANGTTVDDSSEHGARRRVNVTAHEEEDVMQGLGPGFLLRSSNPASTTENPGDEGAALYRSFLANEFRRRNLPGPAEYLSQNSTYHRTQEPTSADLIQAANQLRQLSDEFAKSPMRQWVEDQAARVPLDDLDFDSFSELLYGLFQEGGITWERVVVLFHFCADLAVRAFRERLPQQFYNIVDWSFRYFAGEQMLRWVAENGGWAKVLQKSVDNAYKLARIGFFVMGILAFAAYIWKSQ